MSIVRKIRRALRGEVAVRTVVLEVWRRGRARREQRRERAMLGQPGDSSARLCAEFERLTAAELLKHFRGRTAPSFLPGFAASVETTAGLQRSLFPSETAELVERAARIADEHCWELLGFGERCFGTDINWRRDPLSGFDWPLQFHADVQLTGRADGSDARVLWELNRLAQLLTLARAYAVTNDERLGDALFSQLAGWREQNPQGLGANWACAMEVALRAMNLLGAFELLRRSPALSAARLQELLRMFDEHGAHIRRNLEFSYISTSNHYLSDVVGLLWLGCMLPELRDAVHWREFGLREMLREMDKQVLADGADCEASTGYHRLVLELFLYSFILCRANGIEIEGRYWEKLRAMLDYVCAYLRPDGRAPLIGDTDSGQVLPVLRRAADDHAYVLALGAAVFQEARFKQAAGRVPEELLWVLGAEGVREFESLPAAAEKRGSAAFADAGTYILRDRDLYLLFNASGNGLMGRGSHGHNDALGLEVSACGVGFITDPGTYVYSADLGARQLFRSTAYHSTVEVDGAEQNTTDERLPFVIGNEAAPRLLRFETGAERDRVAAEHGGYARPGSPLTHRRTVELDKRGRYWLVEDALLGAGEHTFCFRFHLAAGLETGIYADGIIRACDMIKNTRLFISALDRMAGPTFEPRFVSRDYGAKSASVSVCWKLCARAPLRARWAILPVCADEDEDERLALLERLREECLSQ
ncbi:MAG TPA: alginate lyase family protein [Pyrinomonadaceae bacterium]|jgi:hypothetical protein